MWRDKLQWDESLPQSLETFWSEFCKEVSEVGYGEIPRYVLQPRAILEVHAFCDVNLLAHGACIYARSVQKVRSQVTLSLSIYLHLSSLAVPKLHNW